MRQLATALTLAALAIVPAMALAEPAAPPAASLEGMVGPALYVTDPVRSLKFYTEGLGMKLRMRFGTSERRPLPDRAAG